MLNCRVRKLLPKFRVQRSSTLLLFSAPNPRADADREEKNKPTKISTSKGKIMTDRGEGLKPNKKWGN